MSKTINRCDAPEIESDDVSRAIGVPLVRARIAMFRKADGAAANRPNGTTASQAMHPKDASRRLRKLIGT